jgi:hypothetical protein
VADETEKITYEIVIDASQATATGNKVADSFGNIEQASKKATSSIKDHSDQIDKLVPGLGSMTSGIASATKASLAFIATPLGAVIAALGVAVASVTAYFKSSEEAENKLTVVTKTLGAVFEQLTNFAEDLGEMIVSVFEDPQKALTDFANLIKENIVNRFVGMLELIPKLGSAIGLLFEGKFVEAGKTAFDAVAKVTTGIADASNKIEGFIKKVGDAVEAGITNGQRLANLQAEIDKKQRDLIEERAKTDIEVIKLREKAVKEEGETKRQIIQKAIDLEVALSNKEVELAKIKQQQAKLESENNGATKEALTKIAEANANLINAEATRYQNTLRFHKEIEHINDEEEANADKRLERELKRIDDEKKAKEKALQDEVKNQEEVDHLFDKQDQERTANELEQANNRYDNYKKDKDKEAKIDDAIAKNRVTTTQTTLGKLSSLYAKNSVEYKALAITQTSIDTYQAAVAAYKSLAGIPYVGPILGAIAAAAAVAFGLSSIDKIAGFAQGGLSGTRIMQGMGKSVYRSNGDNMVATVRTGEVILNERQQAALGGDRTFAAIGVPGFAGGGITDSQLTYSLNNSAIDAQVNSDRQIDRMISKINSIQPVVVIEDVENTINKRSEIRERATL